MTHRLLYARDSYALVPVAAVCGAGLAAIQPGPFLAGWGGASALFALGLSALLAAWRWGGAGKALGWMTALALLLRLAAGVAVYIALPRDGYNEPDDRAGYVFTDAHRRDDQAWQLARSGKPVWAAFDKSYYTDQYGGLLALSALSYKVFSPDSHRPLNVMTFAALAAALGVPFFARAARLIGNGNVSRTASWMYVLYPEAVLTGGAQMREPFLLTLIAMTLWGFVAWTRGSDRRHLIWVAAGMLGLLIVSPAIALALLVVLSVWLRLPGARAHLSWPLVLAAGAVLLAGVVFLAWSLASRDAGPSFLPGTILNWVRDSVTWVIYQLERGSGQIQNVFSKLGAGTQYLFVVGYGIAQPVLPPAFLEPTTMTWHAIAIFRSLGWYVMLPLLLYAPVAVRGSAPGWERRVWAWLVAFCWTWIVICSIRAGGSQWDNPRYRQIFLGFQALAAAFAWHRWREHRDGWLPRIVLAEVLCLALFGQWYLARYQHVGIHFPIMVVLGLCITGVLLILASGHIWDRWRRRA